MSLLQGLVENVETVPARSFATADAAAAATVVYVADASEFFTSTGSCPIDISGIAYLATPTVDDVGQNDFLTVSPALKVAVPESTPITVTPPAEVKWAWVSLNDDSDEDLLKCRVPRSLKAYKSMDDGPRNGDGRESVQVETEPEPHIVDPDNDASSFNANTTPVVVESEDGEAVRVDGDGITAFTDNQQVVWVGKYAFSLISGSVAAAADPEGLLTGVVYAKTANDHIHRFDLATGAESTLGGVFPLDVSAVGCDGIAATKDWVYIIDSAEDIRRYSALTGVQDGNPWKVATADYIAADDVSVYANDYGNNIRKYDAVTGAESGSPWKSGAFVTVATDGIGNVYALDTSGPVWRKYDSSSGTEDTTGDWPFSTSANSVPAATPDWFYVAFFFNGVEQYEAADGTPGTFAIPDLPISSVAAFGGYVVAITDEKVLTCWSIPGTRTISWRLSAADGQVFAPPFANQPVVYSTKAQRTVSAFNIGSGSTAPVNMDTFTRSGGSSGITPYYHWDGSSGVRGWVIDVDGVYSFSAKLNLAANATGRREVSIRVNGSNTLLPRLRLHTVDGNDVHMPISLIGVPLVAGDIVDLGAFQNSGVNLDAINSWFSIKRDGDLAA